MIVEFVTQLSVRSREWGFCVKVLRSNKVNTEKEQINLRSKEECLTQVK